MHAEKQHRRREYHHVVDAEGIHRPARQDDVAMDIGFFDDFALAVLMRDASADRLVPKSEVAVQPIRRCADSLGLKSHRIVADDGIFDVGDDLLPGHGFDMVGVDVADEPVLQASLERVAPGMREDVARVGMNVDLLYGRILRPELALDIHDLSFTEYVSSSGRRRYQSASSIGPRCSARSISETADNSSVGVISLSRCPAIGGKVLSSPSDFAT